MNYEEFIEAKTSFASDSGFKPVWHPDFLFDFQSHLFEWALRKGRAAVFADCGLGKTPMQLCVAENVVRKTNKPFLLLTPLAVAHQTKREAEKFGIEAEVSRDGHCPGAKVVIANYEKLHLFDASEFSGCGCDESSILKNFDGVTRGQVTDFMRKMSYRYLWTATAAPNDFTELGTSSEALGYLGHTDMLGRFFKNDQNVIKPLTYRQRGQNFEKLTSGKWRFRGHAEKDFWRWVCSWARAVRKPSDLGFDDGAFVLPPLNVIQHIVKSSIRNPDFLFDVPAVSLVEQRAERRRSLRDRCEKAASLVSARKGSSVSWCALNDEGDLLADMIPNSAQISGADSDERKEELFDAFQSGQLQRLITKGSIAGFGLNWQHCDHHTYFPSHSFEEWYQCVRRSWRFGQKNTVTIDVIASEGEQRVLQNLQRKEQAAARMFSQLISLMNDVLHINKTNTLTQRERIPSWLPNK